MASTFWGFNHNLSDQFNNCNFNFDITPNVANFYSTESTNVEITINIVTIWNKTIYGAVSVRNQLSW